MDFAHKGSEMIRPGLSGRVQVGRLWEGMEFRREMGGKGKKGGMGGVFHVGGPLRAKKTIIC